MVLEPGGSPSELYRALRRMLGPDYTVLTRAGAVVAYKTGPTKRNRLGWPPPRKK